MATAGRHPAHQRQGLDAARPPHHAALYRNNHNGTFTDITAGSGLDIEIYGMGVAIGDYDNDGRDDVYITALGGDHLFHNEGNGNFRDVTKNPASQRNFGIQRRLVRLRSRRQARSLRRQLRAVDQKGDLWCSLDGSTKSYCTPESYKGTRSKLYHNLAAALRGCDAKGRPGRSHQQVAGRYGARLSTTTAGPTCSSPTTRSPTSSTATWATARSKKKA
jgi:hypothetical protein